MSVFTSLSGALGKHITRDGSGQMNKEPRGNIYNGEVRTTLCKGLDDLAALRRSLKPNQALSFGVCTNAPARVVMQEALPATPGAVARDRDHFDWPSGPGVFLVDHDPLPGQPVVTPAELASIVRAAEPALRFATMLWMPSISAEVVVAVNGERAYPAGGQRLYVVVDDASQIVRIGGLLFDRLALMGHARLRISRAGTLLHRSLVDDGVWQPERLDFAAPTLGPGLRRQLIAAQVFEAEGDPPGAGAVFGDRMLVTADVQNLTDDEKRRVDACWRNLKSDPVTLAKAELQREVWAHEQAREQLGEQAGPEEVSAAAAHIADCASQNRITLAHVLTLADGRRMTVEAALADDSLGPQPRCADPVEDGPDKRVALLMRVRTTNRPPAIFSHLHGGVMFDIAGLGQADGIPFGGQTSSGADLQAFWAYRPDHKFLHIATRTLWPGASVNAELRHWPMNPATGKAMKPADWLDQYRAVQQMTWHPGEPQIITDRIVFEGGWADQLGAKIFNLYRAPDQVDGDASRAGVWEEHLRRIYPNDAEHITKWLAHRVQRPGDKLNHALVLGGSQGIGKDTILAPARAAVGNYNCADVSPSVLVGRFNGFVKSVLLVVSEARDAGEVTRYAFYEATKTLIAAPPDVIRVDEKNLREHYVPNVVGVVITTNNQTDGLYLPADDRRHYVAWSNATKEEFDERYWQRLWKWYSAGGLGHVAAYLAGVDLSGFDPKAPPPKTPAFWVMVSSGEAPESGELRDLIDALPDPSAFSLADLIGEEMFPEAGSVLAEMNDRRQRRAVPHKLQRVGYLPVRNPNATDGLWVMDGRRQSIYARAKDSPRDQLIAAENRLKSKTDARRRALSPAGNQ